MSTNQPIWKYVENFGDVNWKEYGGAFLFVDETGVYAPELEILEEPAEDAETQVWVAYRIVLDKCFYTKGVLSDNKYHKNVQAWFGQLLVDSGEEDEEQAIENLCSDDPKLRAMGYLHVVGHYGAYEFDQYPQTFNSSKVDERYEKLGVV